jgi:FkbM family methyltransferase
MSFVRRVRSGLGDVKTAAREPWGVTTPSIASRALNLRLGGTAGFAGILRPGLDVWGGWLTATKGDVGFVQIGAFDGESNDPIHDLVHRLGWRGVLVEPQPQPFARLQQNYAGVDGLVLLNAAVSRDSGHADLWRVPELEPDDPPWIAQCASLDRGRLEHEIGKADPSVRASLLARVAPHRVETVTLPDVFARAPRPVDVLQIDAEGYDPQIVRMLDEVDTWPTIVRFEHCNISPADHAATMQWLREHGYGIAVDVDDTLAARYTPGRGSTTAE